MPRERLALWAFLAATFAVRAVHVDQPIVENYVGRQIPTAMVARNLERGSGFLHPQLDTGPFPNHFLVEPPIYAGVVVLVRPLIGFDREATGRLVSALAITLGAWGLHGLARRREGPAVALIAVASFAAFPVTVRYGRAFQPDALMVGFVLAGLRGWDEFQTRGNRRWAVFGGFVLATGLALKVTSAWALIPFVLIVPRLTPRIRLALATAMLVPAFAWYLHAWGEVGRIGGGGSIASSDNAAIWIRALSPAAWVRFSTLTTLAQTLLVRSFTPVGFVLAALGLFFSGPLDRLWRGWGIGCALAVLAFAAKWHHGYYWMVVAPLAAVGVARGLVKVGGLGKSGRWLAATLGSFFLGLCVVQSASTFRTPVEWSGLISTARAIDAALPRSESPFLIAPEALLYYADRRGFRLEFDSAAARRAAGEWGLVLPDADRPLALVDFYARPDSRPLEFYPEPFHVADVGRVEGDPRRQAWRDAVRARPGTVILIDRPDALVAVLRGNEGGEPGELTGPLPLEVQSRKSTPTPANPFHPSPGPLERSKP